MPVPSVLVVDPNPATARRVEEALVEVALEVLTARDAESGRGQAQDADLRIVLLAASLPRGNGYDLARALRQEHADTPILLMTGGFEVYSRDRAHEAGVTGHLIKPFTTQRLRVELERHLGPLDRLLPAPEPAGDLPPLRRSRPPTGSERVATIIPRDYQDVPLVQVDPAVVGPELERAVLEVLPEVVEGVLRQSLETSPTFRDLVAAAVDEAVQRRLPQLVGEAIDQRLKALEEG